MSPIVPERLEPRRAARSALPAHFWGLEHASSARLDGVAWSAPGEPAPLPLLAPSGLVRTQEILALQALGVPAVPSWHGGSPGGGLGFDRALLSIGGPGWWAAAVGRFRAQKALGEGIDELRSARRRRRKSAASRAGDGADRKDEEDGEDEEDGGGGEREVAGRRRLDAGVAAHPSRPFPLLPLLRPLGDPTCYATLYRFHARPGGGWLRLDAEWQDEDARRVARAARRAVGRGALALRSALARRSARDRSASEPSVGGGSEFDAALHANRRVADASSGRAAPSCVGAGSQRARSPAATLAVDSVDRGAGAVPSSHAPSLPTSSPTPTVAAPLPLLAYTAPALPPEYEPSGHVTARLDLWGHEVRASAALGELADPARTGVPRPVPPRPFRRGRSESSAAVPSPPSAVTLDLSSLPRDDGIQYRVGVVRATARGDAIARSAARAAVALEGGGVIWGEDAAAGRGGGSGGGGRASPDGAADGGPDDSTAARWAEARARARASASALDSDDEGDLLGLEGGRGKGRGWGGRGAFRPDGVGGRRRDWAGAGLGRGERRASGDSGDAGSGSSGRRRASSGVSSAALDQAYLLPDLQQLQRRPYDGAGVGGGSGLGGAPPSLPMSRHERAWLEAATAHMRSQQPLVTVGAVEHGAVSAVVGAHRLARLSDAADRAAQSAGLTPHGFATPSRAAMRAARQGAGRNDESDQDHSIQDLLSQPGGPRGMHGAFPLPAGPKGRNSGFGSTGGPGAFNGGFGPSAGPGAFNGGFVASGVPQPPPGLASPGLTRPLPEPQTAEEEDGLAKLAATEAAEAATEQAEIAALQQMTAHMDAVLKSMREEEDASDDDEGGSPAAPLRGGLSSIGAPTGRGAALSRAAPPAAPLRPFPLSVPDPNEISQTLKTSARLLEAARSVGGELLALVAPEAAARVRANAQARAPRGAAAGRAAAALRHSPLEAHAGDGSASQAQAATSPSSSSLAGAAQAPLSARLSAAKSLPARLPAPPAPRPRSAFLARPHLRFDACIGCVADVPLSPLEDRFAAASEAAQGKSAQAAAASGRALRSVFGREAARSAAAGGRAEAAAIVSESTETGHQSSLERRPLPGRQSSLERRPPSGALELAAPPGEGALPAGSSPPGTPSASRSPAASRPFSPLRSLRSRPRSVASAFRGWVGGKDEAWTALDAGVRVFASAGLSGSVGAFAKKWNDFTALSIRADVELVPSGDAPARHVGAGTGVGARVRSPLRPRAALATPAAGRFWPRLGRASDDTEPRNGAQSGVQGGGQSAGQSADRNVSSLAGTSGASAASTPPSSGLLGTMGRDLSASGDALRSSANRSALPASAASPPASPQRPSWAHPSLLPSMLGHSVTVSLTQQLYGPLRARLDACLGAEPGAVPPELRGTALGALRSLSRARVGVRDAAAGLDLVLPASAGAAKIVAWYSPIRKEAMLEIRLL